MSRLLAVTWNAGQLRYVDASTDKRGRLRILDGGEEPFADVDAEAAEGAGGASIVTGVNALISRRKAEKARLLILVNRGSVDSTTLTVPPAEESELPALVQNLALQQIPGATDETLMDFIAYAPADDGTRSIRAMALIAEDQQLIRRLMKESVCRDQRVLVATHSLRAYLPAEVRQDQAAATLVISRSSEAAEVALFVGDLPILSRTIRLPKEVSSDEIIRYLTSEVQRMLISAGGHLSEPLEVSRIVVVGSDDEVIGLDIALSHHFAVDAVVSKPASLLEALPNDRDAASGDDASSGPEWTASGRFAGLLGALKEEAAGVVPVIDFANPRRPPVQRSPVRRWLAAAVTAGVLVGGGWYYAWSQFAEIDSRNSRLTTRLNELNELVRETQAKRRLAASLASWHRNRISWPDELRDLTNRIPNSPNLVVQQLSVAQGNGGAATVTFRGVGRQPEVIQQLENSLRDNFHDLRIPGIREQQEGNRTVWTFQTTMTIRSRSADQYDAGADLKESAKPKERTVRK